MFFFYLVPSGRGEIKDALVHCVFSGVIFSERLLPLLRRLKNEVVG